MKKLAFLFTLLAGATAVQAQDTPRFGLKVGVVAANVSGKDAEARFGGSIQNRLGFQAGFTTTATIGTGDFFQFHPELLYSQRGFQIKRGGAEQRTTLHYIDLPLPLRVKAAGLTFEAGPQAGYLIGRNSRGSVLGGETSNIQRLDIGYIVGVGYELESGPNINVRYNGGIKRLFENSANDNVRNSVFQFQLGFAFPSSN